MIQILQVRDGTASCQPSISFTFRYFLFNFLFFVKTIVSSYQIDRFIEDAQELQAAAQVENHQEHLVIQT